MIGPLTPTGPSQTPPSERERLREAAQGFEAFLVRKLLESARASSFAEDTPLTGGGMKQYAQMRDEHFAEIAAQSGAFGFARSIEEQLSQHLAQHRG
ncbi:MAG: rod-binding protein [Erythrobacter sp.]|nr:rod-binding protein [Erythrobacter sp.]